MAVFENHQARLRELGVEAGDMRRAADASTGEGRKSFNAQYSRLMTKIDQTIAIIKAEHPKRCWQDDDPGYGLLKSQWSLERAERRRQAAEEEKRIQAAMEAIVMRIDE